jgi:hypothetical protein
MSRYGSFSDDYYVNVNVNTEMDLPQNRETVLHFFELIQKKYPAMRNFYSRERGEYVLEEEKENGNYRWATVESRRVCSGIVNPASIEESLEQHRLILDLAPAALSVSSLDCESVNLMFGFDYTYRGNHNQLLIEALGLPPSFDKLLETSGVTAMSYEPALQLSLEEDCRTQCRLSFETRTSAYHVRSGDYPEEQLSVYLTARRFGSLDPGETFAGSLDKLNEACKELIDGYLIDNVLRPLQQAIAIK